jgi:hypothetical protein
LAARRSAWRFDDAIPFRPDDELAGQTLLLDTCGHGETNGTKHAHGVHQLLNARRRTVDLSDVDKLFGQLRPRACFWSM